MKRIVVSIRDAASELYGQPFFVVARGQAVRTFADEVQRPAEDNPLYKHPGDFELYMIGEFDEESGRFENAPGGNERLARGLDYSPRGD